MNMTNAQLKLVEGNNVEVTTLATAAVLLDVNISSWTGRRRDKSTTKELTDSKHAGSSKAASVIKNLMSDDTDLDAIRAYAQDTRLYLGNVTLRWSDGGTRLLPSAMIFEVTSELEGRIQEYERRVNVFVNNYAVKVSAAAFKLGQLFDRSEYPDAEDVRRRFSMRYVMSPVPTSGDFRVDVQNDVSDFLKEQFAKDAQQRMVDMMREPWQRVYDQLTHVQERMAAALAHDPDESATDKRHAPKLYQSMLDNALELVALLDKLNIVNDPDLTECAARMRRVFAPLDIKSVRESKELKESVKKQVDELLDTFNFTGFGE